MSVKRRRADVIDTVKMSLLCEVHGSCPLCRRHLMTQKDNKRDVRVFDVAHIYPLNATSHEKSILSGEKILCDDVDSKENLIALCKECHKVYDTDKTVEEYRRLFNIKNEINKAKVLYAIWDTQTLHKDILKVSEAVSKLSMEDMEETKLSYQALTLSSKIDTTFSISNEIKVSQYITLFYVPIKKALIELERLEKAKSEFICQQVKCYFIALKMHGFNQNQIFEKMTGWFMTNTGIDELSKAEVLVSYFIQNCEVYS